MQIGKEYLHANEVKNIEIVEIKAKEGTIRVICFQIELYQLTPSQEV